MKKHFYSHIFAFEKFSFHLDSLDLSEDERKELLELAETSFHHIVLDTILSELSSEDKKLFLSHIAKEDHESIWELLHGKIEDAEWKIWRAVEKHRHELRRDIIEAKNKKNG
jgi:hypothetical protein